MTTARLTLTLERSSLERGEGWGRERREGEKEGSPRSARFLHDDDMLMYGCVVHKRVWKEVPKENAPMLSTSQSRHPSPSLVSSAGPRDTPFVADGFLSVQDERGPDVVPSHCRPAFFICIQCWRHPRGTTEPSSSVALPLPLNYLFCLFSLRPDVSSGYR